jgi:hypothetical protein
MRNSLHRNVGKPSPATQSLRENRALLAAIKHKRGDPAGRRMCQAWSRYVAVDGFFIEVAGRFYLATRIPRQDGSISLPR